MSRIGATILGMLNLLPLTYLVYFIAGMMAIDTRNEPSPARFENLVLWHLATMGLIIVLTIVYLVIAYRAPNVPNDKRTFWATVLFMGNMFAFPVFWYLFVWRKHSPTDASG